MHCPCCKAPNDDNARHCQNCGATFDFPLAISQVVVKDNSYIYLLIAMGWELLVSLFWVSMMKILYSPKFDFAAREHLIEAAEVILGGITVAMLIVFAFIVKNMPVRICLIIFAGMRILLMINYLVSLHGRG